jgi:hypothetical protein
MTLPRFQLAHQALAAPVGRKQMLGIHAKDTPVAIRQELTWCCRLRVTLGRRHAGRVRSDP